MLLLLAPQELSRARVARRLVVVQTSVPAAPIDVVTTMCYFVTTVTIQMRMRPAPPAISIAVLEPVAALLARRVLGELVAICPPAAPAPPRLLATLCAASPAGTGPGTRTSMSMIILIVPTAVVHTTGYRIVTRLRVGVLHDPLSILPRRVVVGTAARITITPSHIA